MRQVFVDTSAWDALADSRDAHHELALLFRQKITGRAQLDGVQQSPVGFNSGCTFHIQHFTSSMTDIAIRVENCILSRAEGLSKLYHIGRAQQRHDTLRDVLVSTFERSNVRTFHRPLGLARRLLREPVLSWAEGSSAAKWWASLRHGSELALNVMKGQASAATARGRAPSLRRSLH